jgi:A/G-specific adenine glycosylase
LQGGVRVPFRKLRSSVIGWFRENGRDFPWRRTDDPFNILVAEVLLRQTQAERVVGPYLQIISEFPNVQSLVSARPERIRAIFRPLGLHQRADTLIGCATLILESHGGAVPSDATQLISLPGIGRYAANAILCLAHGRPVPMVDEGSGRVLRRVLGQEARGPAGADRELSALASRALSARSPREFNLGVLDIAHEFCRPKNPRCGACPLATICKAARGVSVGEVV